jgi:phosphopantothenoylcysteine decarboxylase/phosphopantothenate--cysteine ligase
LENNIFENKRILVGITGSIAAYKGLFLIRELVKKGAIVNVVMTPSATNFITPISAMNLSKNPVAIDMFNLESQTSGAWHIHLVQECDLMIIAPCTASTIGKIANGICDNSLVTLATALPKHKPLLIAPAMDFSMWLNSATQRNIRLLKEYGIVVIPPEEGELSSGLEGEGRLPETQVLLDYIETYLHLYSEKEQQTLGKVQKINGKKVLITAGPTYERIDDVRFIGNFSSGKMGFAIAEVAAMFGANVTLIAGPTKLNPPSNVTYVPIESANEMYREVLNYFTKQDIIIMSAAVADFKPISNLKGKLKKESVGGRLKIELEQTEDILLAIGKRKKANQILVGFALEETRYSNQNALKKLQQKNCDILVLNFLDKPNSGFQSDLNTIVIYKQARKGSLEVETLPPMSKLRCGLEILRSVIELKDK